MWGCGEGEGGVGKAYVAFVFVFNELHLDTFPSHGDLSVGRRNKTQTDVQNCQNTARTELQNSMTRYRST